MSSSSRTRGQQRLAELFEAAVLIEPAGHLAFLDEVCADDPRLRAEVLALLAHEHRLSVMEGPEWRRISGVFHAAHWKR